MRIAKTSKILFVIAAFALSLSLIFSLTGTANVSADGVSASSYFGGTATSVFSGGKLTVKAENDETLSVINKLAIDDFETKFTVDANVNTVTLTLTSDSYFGAGVVLDPTDENPEIVKSVENVILLDYANWKFSLNGTEKPLSGRETELALSVSEKGVLSVTIGGETVSASADDDFHKIGGTNRTAAALAFKFATTAESEIGFEYFDQGAGDSSGKYKQTFEDEKLTDDGKALPRVALKDAFGAKADNTVNVFNGMKYSLTFTSYSLLGWSDSFKIAANEVANDNAELWIKESGDEIVVRVSDMSADKTAKFDVKSGDKVIETYTATAFDETVDTDAPKYDASEQALAAYRLAVQEAVMKTYDGDIKRHIKLGDKMTIPSLKGLVSDGDGTSYDNLKHTVYYRTPTSSTGSTSGWTITVSDAGTYQFFVVFTDEAGNAMEKKDFYETDDNGNYKPPEPPKTSYDYESFVFTFTVEDDAPIYVYPAASQEKGYLNTQYVFSAFTVEASGYTPVYTLKYSATKDGEFKTVIAKSELPSEKDKYTGTDFTYDEISAFAYDGKLTFTPVKAGYYKIECTVSSTKLARSETAETQVVEITQKPVVVKPDTHWLQNNVWSVVFLSIGTLCLIGIVVLLFIKPKEEVDTDSDEK